MESEAHSGSARWTILSSSAAIPSGRCWSLPGLGMNCRRTGCARYVPRWTRSCKPLRFPPGSPRSPAMSHRPRPALCSAHSAAAEAALFAGFFALMAECDFSGPCIIGYGSSPSRCGPARYCGWSDPRSPGSRAKSVHTCQVLRPRRAGPALAIARQTVLPSATRTASAPGTIKLTRLNGWPVCSPADASPTPSRPPAHGLGPMWIATPSSQWTCTTYSLPVSRRTLELF